MSQLEQDIINMAMYKIACYQDEMEKTAGSGGIKNTLRKIKGMFKTNMNQIGAAISPEDTKRLVNTPPDANSFTQTNEPLIKNLLKRFEKGLSRQREAVDLRKAIADVPGLHNKISKTPQGLRALQNNSFARSNYGQNEAYKSVTGNKADFSDALKNIIEQDAAGTLTPQQLGKFLGIDNLEADMLTSRLLNRFG